jgi:putative tryptophan/tyrosine transport system substrate-binding protein
MKWLRGSLIVAVAGSALGAALPAHAQPSRQMPHIGVLVFTPMAPAVQDGFRQGLRDHGYIEGRNVVVEWRSAEGRTERAKAMAAELVKLKVNVIVAEFTPAVQAAKDATSTIPIVMASAGDPVATGLVASLARPGGNVTGLSNVAAELSGKRFELLREILPGVARVGLLIHGADPLDKAFVQGTEAAASSAGIQLHVATVPRPEDLEPALAGMTKAGAAAVIVPANLPVPAHIIAQSAQRYRLPSISLVSQFPEAGGLMSYGASLLDIRRRAVGYVDKILKGATPANMPVERPTTFELVINRKTAAALGLSLPPSLILRADRVIE